MIKIVYDPIMGARYIVVDEKPTDVSRCSFADRFHDRFKRSWYNRIKQMRHNNTKQK